MRIPTILVPLFCASRIVLAGTHSVFMYARSCLSPLGLRPSSPLLVSSISYERPILSRSALRLFLLLLLKKKRRRRGRSRNRRKGKREEIVPYRIQRLEVLKPLLTLLLVVLRRLENVDLLLLVADVEHDFRVGIRDCWWRRLLGGGSCGLRVVGPVLMTRAEGKQMFQTQGVAFWRSVYLPCCTRPCAPRS